MVMVDGKRKHNDYSKINVVEIVKNIVASPERHFALKSAARFHDIPVATLETWVLKFQIYGEKYFADKEARKEAAAKAITNPSLLKRIIRIERHLNLLDDTNLS